MQIFELTFIFVAQLLMSSISEVHSYILDRFFVICAEKKKSWHFTFRQSILSLSTTDKNYSLNIMRVDKLSKEREKNMLSNETQKNRGHRRTKSKKNVMP